MVARSELKARAITLGNEINVVTGAFSYTGQYIARRLLARGKEVRTLTGHPQRAHPLSNQVRAFPLAFDDPRLLQEALRGRVFSITPTGYVSLMACKAMSVPSKIHVVSSLRRERPALSALST
jgi:uncharacterized protein YbjT (DUF2867 family)